jgi:transposase-like protein
VTVFPYLYRPRLYRMVVASKWYDAEDEFEREHEFYFVTRRKGSIRTVRDTLKRRGIRYFQQAIYRWHHQWIPEHKIRFNYVTEEQAEAVDRAIRIYRRSVRFRGKEYLATRLPATEISYAKKNRRAKARRRKSPTAR